MMKKFLNNVMKITLIAIVSGVASVATFVYLNNNALPIKGLLSSSNNNQSPQTIYKMNSKVAGMSTYEKDFTTVAESAVHAVVHIKSTVVQKGQTYVSPFDFFFGGGRYYQTPDKKQEGFGSGVIITPDGYIVTNNHVINKADEIEVTLNDKRMYKAKLVGTDPSTDIALLKIDGKKLPVIPFGNSDALRVGEWVLAVGNPFNLTSTVTAGIVSAKARDLAHGMVNKNGTASIESFIQTDAAVNPGNSGGALINTKGELVGINTAITSQTGNFAGHSFAVPTSIVAKVIDDLKEYGVVQRAVLGIKYQEITQQLKKEKELNTLDGIYVAFVEKGSAANEAGVEKGDVLTAIDGVKTKNSSEFIEKMNRFRPGDEIIITILRGKKMKTVTAKLKNSHGTTAVITGKINEDLLGAEFKPLTKKEKKELGVNYGVKITQLAKGKLQKTGVKEGMIILKANNHFITQPKELELIVKTIMQRGNHLGEQALFLIIMTKEGEITPVAIDLSK